MSATSILCALACLAAGCHSPHLTSGFGVIWVTLSGEASDFSSYIVKVDSVTLTRSDGAVVTALATAENVDFAKLGNVAELWGTGTIPVGSYKSATITLDYTNANISVMVNGVATAVTVVNATGAAVTTTPVLMTFDTANPLVIQPTGTSSSARRLAIDFNLPASGLLSFATSPAKLTVSPFVTAGVLAPDLKLVRVRGPLINSSVLEGTYTVYIRPFHDAVSSLGVLTLFNDANTVYSINGTSYVGAAGLTALSKSSAGTTITAAYTTFQPTTNNSSPPITAGKFNTTYVVAGSTLEDNYTQGIEGDVIARTAGALTLRGSTVSFNNGTFTYNLGDASLNVGPSTIVTADGNAALAGLNASSIAVGQHIEARGLYSLPSSGIVTVDATGATSTNTGSVRLQTTQLWGSLISAGAGVLSMNLQTINNWPVANYKFAGNGATAAQDSLASNYMVNVGTLALPSGVTGTPLWIDGLMAAFGAAPPDFKASAITAESAVPASLRVNWGGGGTSAPFASTLANSGFSIDLGNTKFSKGIIRVGPESIALTSLPASPQVIPTGAAASTAFAPAFALGNAANGITAYNSFANFVSQLNSILATKPVQGLEARGLYDRASNTFTATTVDIVL